MLLGLRKHTLKLNSVTLFSACEWSHGGFLGDLDFLTQSVSSHPEPKDDLVGLVPGVARLYAGKVLTKEDIEDYIVEKILEQKPTPSSKWFSLPSIWNQDDTPDIEMPPLFTRANVLGETGLPAAQV